MKTVTVEEILNKDVANALGHLIYVVRNETLVFYVGQSRRDVLTRFWEHLHAPSHLGQLIAANKPESQQWTVDFYALADCEQFVKQKSLFAMQEWQHFDMDMAEQALIQAMCPVLNRDFNEKPTPLPVRYRGHAVLGLPIPTNVSSATTSPQDRIWLNRMSLQGWVFERVGVNGRIQWQHTSGKVLTEAEMSLYRQSGKLPPA
ncbi:MAG: GIY-YIG nuclease family protein [Chloroflexi bacterium]|nr:GIY-YIG nuclease family protein [Chloroflexota bacterium]